MTAGLLPPGARHAAAAPDQATGLREPFLDAMSQLVTRLAVVTARRDDGEPVGLLVSSLCSFSVRPPSVLVAIDEASRSCPVLAGCSHFGVHLLGAEQGPVADLFAAPGADRFGGQDWRWDGEVPRLAGTPVFLLCVPARVLAHGDHLILIGDVVRVEATPGTPLVHHRRRRTWELRASG